MYLSTLRKSLLVIGFVGLALEGCSSCRTTRTNDVAPTIAPVSHLPFATREPETYQANVVMTTPGIEDRTFVARKGDRHRIDFYAGPKLSASDIVAGSHYLIDHQKKIYYEERTGSGGPSASVSSAASFFDRTEYTTFEEVGRDGSTIQYRARQEGGRDRITLFFDTGVNMITAQEFTSEDGSVNVRYELRDLRMDVDDGVFDVPNGYRKVTPEEYRSTKQK